ncbi:hypothetical protein ES703_118403 [subsurface metagenome]
MAHVMVAQQTHHCTACEVQIDPGDKFAIQMNSSYTPCLVCLACAGLMRKVCAWCQADMGEIEGKGETGTTHGICQACQLKYFPELYPGGKKL